MIPRVKRIRIFYPMAGLVVEKFFASIGDGGKIIEHIDKDSRIYCGQCGHVVGTTTKGITFPFDLSNLLAILEGSRLFHLPFVTICKTCDSHYPRFRPLYFADMHTTIELQQEALQNLDQFLFNHQLDTFMEKFEFWRMGDFAPVFMGQRMATNFVEAVATSFPKGIGKNEDGSIIYEGGVPVVDGDPIFPTAAQAEAWAEKAGSTATPPQTLSDGPQVPPPGAQSQSEDPGKTMEGPSTPPPADQEKAESEATPGQEQQGHAASPDPAV